MSTPSKTASNRRNAKRSTGPRTSAGKKRAALNATRHGLTAELRPLPVVEDGAAWEAHHRQALEALAPQGYLEATLAERVAVILWRLGRAVRFENEAAAMLQEDAGRDTLAANDEAARWRIAHEPKRGEALLESWETTETVGLVLATLEPALALLEELPNLAARKTLDPEAAELVVFEAAENVEEELEDETLPETWTAGKLRERLEDLASRAEEETTLEELLQAVRRELAVRHIVARQKLATYERAENQARRRRLLPDFETLERVSRYESHLHRLLVQTLHELQRLQAARTSGNVPPPLALDVTANLGA